jgi:type II secretory pathway pseudopilin PulG
MKIKKNVNLLIGGFTLVELILYISITSIFMVGVIYFTWDIVYGRVKSYVQQEINQNIRLAGKRIIYELRNASSINSLSSDSISLASVDSSRNPTVISLSDGRLKIGFSDVGDCPISDPCNLTSNLVKVTNLTFTDLSTDPTSKNIRFYITIESTGDRVEFQKSESVESTIELRTN